MHICRAAVSNERAKPKIKSAGPTHSSNRKKSVDPGMPDRSTTRVPEFASVQLVGRMVILPGLFKTRRQIGIAEFCQFTKIDGKAHVSPCGFLAPSDAAEGAARKRQSELAEPAGVP